MKGLGRRSSLRRHPDRREDQECRTTCTRLTALLVGLLGIFALAGCAAPQTTTVDDLAATKSEGKAAGRPAPPIAPRIVHARAPLQCVPYARRHVNISLRGEA
jgi:hypothetical protein